MGAWEHGYFDNDGAADLLAKLAKARNDPAAFVAALDDALASFEGFLARDTQGLTFRPLSPEEIAEHDRIVREALADLPHLIEAWEAESNDPAGVLVDTGNQEAQGAVAAAALLSAAQGASGLELPKRVKWPSGLCIDAALHQRAQSALAALLSNQRLCKQFTGQWLMGVRSLGAAGRP